MGNDVNIISPEAMKSIFQLVATNLKNAREHKDSEQFPNITKLQEGDTVMIKNYTAKSFEPKHIRDFRIVKIIGHKVQFQPVQGGPLKEEHLDHIKYVLPAERYISSLPDYKQFGRKTNLRLNPDKIPDLQWELTDQHNTTQIGEPKISQKDQINMLYILDEVFIHSFYVNVCSYAKSAIDHNTYSTISEEGPSLSVTIT